VNKEMTWAQFKEAVDKELEKMGMSQDVKIWYIDISFPESDDFERGTLAVHFDEHCGIFMWR
jgi:hypothetical protein